jgi:hypothetical protein
VCVCVAMVVWSVVSHRLLYVAVVKQCCFLQAAVHGACGSHCAVCAL